MQLNINRQTSINPTNKHNQTKTKANMNEHRWILTIKDTLSSIGINVDVVTFIQKEQHTLILDK